MERGTCFGDADPNKRMGKAKRKRILNNTHGANVYKNKHEGGMKEKKVTGKNDDMLRY